MKKTKLTRSLLAACSIVALSAVMYGCVHNGDDPPASDDMGMMEPMEPMEPVPVDVTMDVELSAVAQGRLRAGLSLDGERDSDTFDIPAGETVIRANVEFTCDSDYPCTVTVTNSLGTIVAEMTTMALPDDVALVTAMEILPPNALPRLNAANAMTVDGIASVAINADAGTGTPATPRGAHGRDADGTMDEHSIGGLGLGESGAADDTMLTLTSFLDPNGDDFAPANPGATPPTPVMGSTISVEEDETMDHPESVMHAGWDQRVLFRDWGDTVGTGDGGYETAALIYSNIEDAIEHPFDRMLSMRYVNADAMRLYALTILADGMAPAVPAVATSVDINMDASVAATRATTEQWAAMVFDSESLVGAQDQDLNVDANETFTGMYFGAMGEFQCLGPSNQIGCGLMRNADGDVVVADTDANTAGLQNGRWSFTPDPGATIMVPDQDWMVFGSWLTVPDSAAGAHRIGVFYNGMDVYTPASDAFDATNADGLRGSATYIGGAAGVYSHDSNGAATDGMSSGLFTADATLTANFDVNSNGDGTDAGDYSVSGRIANFRDTAGRFIGADTALNPNDPVAGGENDWVVLLNAFSFVGETNDGTTDLATIGATDHNDANANVSGSADGLAWTGHWSGQFFGPGADAMDNSLAPSGVAGQFQADNANTAVVGAFGAMMDDDS